MAETVGIDMVQAVDIHVAEVASIALNRLKTREKCGHDYLIDFYV